MRILVTGGAGFIGSHVCDAYLAEGHEVLAVDDLSTGVRTNVPHRAEFAEADIRDEGFGGIVAGFGPEVISHHAAQISVVVSTQDPVQDASRNVAGTANVLKAAVDLGVERVVFSSSGGAVYGEPEYLPADESHPVKPLAPYGLSKYCGELYLDYFGRMHGLGSVILRYGNVYGPRQDPYGEAGVVAIFSEAMREGRTPYIFGDGDQTRDFIYVRDIARANVSALDAPTGTCMNIGTGMPTSVNDIFRGLKALTGFGGDAEHKAERAGEVRHIHLDCSRARELMGWQAATPLEEGLRLTSEFFGHGY